MGSYSTLTGRHQTHVSVAVMELWNEPVSNSGLSREHYHLILPIYCHYNDRHQVYVGLPPVFTVTGLSSFLHFKQHRNLVSDSRMLALPIVVHFDVIKDSEPCLSPTGIAFGMCQFDLQTMEETLHGRVIVTGCLPAQPWTSMPELPWVINGTVAMKQM